jgi:hypothetical protein
MNYISILKLDEENKLKQRLQIFCMLIFIFYSGSLVIEDLFFGNPIPRPVAALGSMCLLCVILSLLFINIDTLLIEICASLGTFFAGLFVGGDFGTTCYAALIIGTHSLGIGIIMCFLLNLYAKKLYLKHEAEKDE